MSAFGRTKTRQRWAFRLHQVHAGSNSGLLLLRLPHLAGARRLPCHALQRQVGVGGVLRHQHDRHTTDAARCESSCWCAHCCASSRRSRLGKFVLPPRFSSHFTASTPQLLFSVSSGWNLPSDALHVGTVGTPTRTIIADWRRVCRLVEMLSQARVAA